MITTPSNPQKSVNTETKSEEIITQNIAVSSQIVKRVDGKCRYFFDIRNYEATPFEGSVEISLFKENGGKEYQLGREVFDTKAPIEQNLGDSVYFDINTCPVSIHGENGITKYQFVVKTGGNVVNQGEAPISTKFEDIDSYSP